MTPQQHVNFWKKVKKTGTCWIWIGSVSSNGYGTLGINGKSLRAHRVSWMLANGRNELHRWEFICHSCDNPLCVNPSHLWLGDAKANMSDCIAKGRKAKMPIRTKSSHCKRGHPMDENNLRFYKFGKYKYRSCKTCHTAAVRSRRLRLKPPPRKSSAADGRLTQKNNPVP